jgi:hypothetical protein
MKSIATVFLAVFLAVFLCASGAWAGGVGDAVEVRVATDDGRTLPTYPVKMRHGLKKVYAEANRGDHYRIEVRNRLDRRVGLVIAVDGRNIISGGKSGLQGHERMYILEPNGFGEFSGWRTAQDRVNRFYFTDAPDSYAAAFGDESAMGVIAVAVYPEVRRCRSSLPLSRIAPSGPHGREGKATGSFDRAEAAPAAPSATGEPIQKRARSEQSMESAGTGYGLDAYSPSQIVAFQPERQAAEIIFLKYEWRATLCRLGVAGCAPAQRRPPNRLWDHDGYAPPPPAPGWER